MTDTLDRIGRVASADDKLTTWEIDLLETIRERLENGEPITARQREQFDQLEARLIDEGII